MLAVIKTMIADLSHARKRKENRLPNWARCGKMMGLDGHTSTSLHLWKRRWKTFGKLKGSVAAFKKAQWNLFLLFFVEVVRRKGKLSLLFSLENTVSHNWTNLVRRCVSWDITDLQGSFSRNTPITKIVRIICQRSDKLQTRLEKLLATEHWAETSDKHGWQWEKMSNYGVEIMDSNFSVLLSSLFCTIQLKRTIRLDLIRFEILLCCLCFFFSLSSSASFPSFHTQHNLAHTAFYLLFSLDVDSPPHQCRCSDFTIRVLFEETRFVHGGNHQSEPRLAATPTPVLFRPRWQKWLTRPPTGEMKQSEQGAEEMANEISNARITGGVKLSGLGNRRNVERDIPLPQESQPIHNPSYEWNNIIIGHMKQTLTTTFLSWTTRQSDTKTTHTMLQ